MDAGRALGVADRGRLVTCGAHGAMQPGLGNRAWLPARAFVTSAVECYT